MKLSLKSLSLVAAFAAAAVSAQAQASNSDLILGFKQSTGTGNATSLEIDLGNTFATTTAVAAGTYDLGNISSLISSTYGSSWATSSTLTYGVVGNTIDLISGNNTDWATSKWSNQTGTLGVQNSATFGTVGDSALSGTASKVQKVYASSFAVDGSGFSNAVVTATAQSGWKTNDPFNFTTAKLDTVVSSNGTDLYVIASDGSSGTANFLGTFNLSSAGELTFTTGAAIPEPSTYAMILGALTIGFVALRRRFSKAV
jgi:hypothetical protein